MKTNANPKSAYSRASLIFGGLSLVLMFCVMFSPVFGALAIIFAFMSRYKKQFDTTATVGLVLGSIGLMIGLLLFTTSLELMGDPEFISEANEMYQKLMEEATRNSVTTPSNLISMM